MEESTASSGPKTSGYPYRSLKKLRSKLSPSANSVQSSFGSSAPTSTTSSTGTLSARLIVTPKDRRALRSPQVSQEKKGYRVNRKNPSYRFVKAWSWPAGVEDFLEKHIEPCENRLAHIHCLHVCCGDSRLGDLKVDLYNPNADIRADMFHLPIKPGSVCNAICDPPWHLPYDVRHHLIYQLRDVLKPGGRLIFNCIWSPKVRGIEMEPFLYYGQPNATWRNGSLLFLARRSALTATSQEMLA